MPSALETSESLGLSTPCEVSLTRDSPNRHATVFLLSLKPALNKLCDYSLVPGTIAGISQHLLFLDTTSQQDGGGLEVLDWHAKTEGTALLPRIPELVSLASETSDDRPIRFLSVRCLPRLGPFLRPHTCNVGGMH